MVASKLRLLQSLDDISDSIQVKRFQGHLWPKSGCVRDVEILLWLSGHDLALAKRFQFGRVV